jgi:hypothetical protein
MWNEARLELFFVFSSVSLGWGFLTPYHKGLHRDTSASGIHGPVPNQPFSYGLTNLNLDPQRDRDLDLSKTHKLTGINTQLTGIVSCVLKLCVLKHS